MVERRRLGLRLAVVVRTKNNMNIEGSITYTNMHNRNCIMTINYKTYVVRLIYSSKEHKKTGTTWSQNNRNTISIIIIFPAASQVHCL